MRELHDVERTVIDNCILVLDNLRNETEPYSTVYTSSGIERMFLSDLVSRLHAVLDSSNR